MPIELAELEAKTVEELQEVAKEFEVADADNLDKHDLAIKILQARGEQEGQMVSEGVLEILSDGWGFLRVGMNYAPKHKDIYVSQSQIKRFALKTGDAVLGYVRPPKEGTPERYLSLLRVEAVNGDSPDTSRNRVHFDDLTPIYPTKRLRMETTAKNISGRFIDIIAPIGMGQRGMIVSPPKAGKTTLLKQIANSVTTNHPEVVLIVLLIDERPEEVTDIRRSVKGEVVASTFDETPENHLRIQEIVLERAKRLVERGKDVVILLDSLTRLGRASNLTVAPSGRTLSGGLDPSALIRPKRFFASARNIEEGGSLTVIATALVDTGSRMDDMIFEEFKATGNMELVLDRSLADRGIFPAIAVQRSGTRHQELLFTKEELQRVWQIRKVLNHLEGGQATELLLTGINKTSSNKEFLKWVEKELRS
ncbi:MAG: transcription termination factor Rho [Armatimonadetes bacterium]|nr:transcription termination factor Rho [Armatimonadota bacterium]NIO75509.1 transcription termination factor Rho [Armatimonadota bacterium]NIO95886.1 transcription termination factor Rho [Armatimonadota bacterium]